MKKRILSVLITLVMLIGMLPITAFAAETTYGIWVEGVEVTSDNQDNVLGKDGWRDGASVRYDPATSTLTLNYATLKAVNTVPQTYGAYCAVYIGENAPADVTVVVKGTNSIVAESSGQSAYGIYCHSNKNLTIKNYDASSSLGIQAESQVTYSDSSYALGIYGCKTLTLDGCSLSIDVNGTARLTYGIFISNISSAVVSVKNNAQVNLSSKGTALTNRAISFNGGGTLSVDNTSTLIMDTDDDAAYIGTYTPATGSVMLIDTNYDGILEAYLEKPYNVSYGHVEIHPAIKVTLNLSGANASNRELYWAKGVSFPEPFAPSIQGYVFAGWYTSSSYTTAFNFNQLRYSDTTIYAKFLNYDGNKTELNNKIDAAKAELQDKIGDVESALAGKADAATLAQAITDLNTAKTNIQTLLEADTALKAELITQIENADNLINTAISDLTSRVQTLESELAAAKSDISTNASKVAQLTADLATLNASLTDLSNKLTNDYATKAELTNAINSAKDTINSTIDALTIRVQNLEAGLAEVNGKININTTDVGTLKTDVSTLKTWQTEAQNAIEALETLTGTQETNISALQTAVAELQATMNTANGKIAAAENRIAALEDKVSALETAKTNLENAVSALQTAVADKADTATVNAAIAELEAAIDALEAVKNNYATADATLKAELEGKIATAKGEAISAAEALVNNAKAELQSKIDAKADAATINEAIANLQNAITALEAAKDNYADADAALKLELEAAIERAKQEAIEASKGYIPYIGTNGNWWIGDTDTGVDANGIKGDTGATGNGIASITTSKTNGITTVTIKFTDPNMADVVFTIEDGADGAKGDKGDTGAQGAQGEKGDKGDKGNTGAQGEKGDKGNTGAAGADGVGIAKIEKTSSDGNVDTYTITLTNGTTYTFTVTNGTNGTDGKDGKDGVDGKDGTNGTNGVDGKDGTDGEDGQTPYIGENGNWWIGNTDTGVKAAGDDGKDGAIIVATAVGGTALISNIALIAWTLIKKKRLF